MLFKCIVFHNFGFCTENELSNRVLLAAQLVRLLGGMMDNFSSLGREIKVDVNVIAGL
jgi:hypothetical protein